MKKKVFNKKLGLNKRTMANLEEKQMKDLKAGRTAGGTCIWSEITGCTELRCYGTQAC